MSDNEVSDIERAQPQQEMLASAPWKMRFTDNLKTWIGYNIAMSLAAIIVFFVTARIMSSIFGVSAERLVGSLVGSSMGFGSSSPGVLTLMLVLVIVISTIPSLFVALWQIYWNVKYFTCLRAEQTVGSS